MILLYHDKLYFFATTSAAGAELWTTDGTAAGTTLVADLFPGNSSNSTFLAVSGDKLYFSIAKNLYVSDGTAANTVSLVSPEFSSGAIRELTDFKGTLYFANPQGANDDELWKTDGTVAGTTVVRRFGTVNEIETSGSNVYVLASDFAGRISGDMHNFYNFLSDDAKDCLQEAVKHMEKSFEESFVIRFVTKLACEHKILTFLVANANTVLRIQPPLILTKEQATYFVSAFTNVCEDMSTFLN